MKGWKGEVTKHWISINVQKGFKPLIHPVYPNPGAGKTLTQRLGEKSPIALWEVGVRC